MVRIITSLVLTALILAALYFDPFWWLVFITFFSIGAGIEFSNVLYRGKLFALRVLVVGACFAFPVNVFMRINELPSLPDTLLVAFLFVFAPILFIFSKGPIEEFHTSVPMAVFGSLWIGFLLSFLIEVRYLRLEGYLYGAQAIFFFIIVVTCSDIFAYYLGQAFGKHKMSPLYSPKKTWEGAVGGVLGGLGGAYLCLFNFAGLFTPLHCGIMALVIVFFGMLGDLAESVFKRSCNVKDAGGFLPGHGGILDRIDSVLLSAPAFYWYIYFVLAK
jgi:phosphatidate cytidylyltransferase